MPLTLKQANTICEKALEHARAKNFAKLTIVVLDESGNLKAMQREDDASMFRYDVALGKAWGAVAMSCSSRALANRAKGNPNFFLTLASKSIPLVSVATSRIVPFHSQRLQML